jgi:hypothetical protein
MCVCERERKRDRDREREIYLMELALVITEASESKSAGQSSRLETQGRTHWRQNSLSLWKLQSFSLKTFNRLDETQLHHGGESALLRTTDFDVNII